MDLSNTGKVIVDWADMFPDRNQWKAFLDMTWRLVNFEYFFFMVLLKSECEMHARILADTKFSTRAYGQ